MLLCVVLSSSFVQVQHDILEKLSQCPICYYRIHVSISSVRKCWAEMHHHHVLQFVLLFFYVSDVTFKICNIHTDSLKYKHLKIFVIR